MPLSVSTTQGHLRAFHFCRITVDQDYILFIRVKKLATWKKRDDIAVIGLETGASSWSHRRKHTEDSDSACFLLNRDLVTRLRAPDAIPAVSPSPVTPPDDGQPRATADRSGEERDGGGCRTAAGVGDRK